MKAIIVIDVEEKDIGRKVNYISVQGGGMSYIVGSMGNDVRLRPLPQRKETDGTEPFEIFMHREGWNQCLDEITGETEPMERYL